MFFGSTALIDAEMFNTLLYIRTMLVLVNIYSRAVLSGWVIVLGGSVRVDDSEGFCPGFFCPGV